MSVKIYNVKEKSIASKKKFEKGDEIISINNNDINDVLDYDFYAADQKIEVVLKKQNEKLKTIKIRKNEYDDLGLEFETYLIDKQHSCKNKCMFCFVDQMPPDMRKSLYFKDDDSRLSFLFGNYITLTNMEQTDIDRIVKMHISPINISVHTTNPELRVKMMKNPRAAESLKYLTDLKNGGISMNCQLVLCPDVNDGDELKKTLNDLKAMYPQVQTIACVPVGLTKFREKLAKIEPYTKEQANKVIDIVEEFSKEFKAEYGEIIAYAADEFYVKAEREIPDYEYYGDFNQIENGVGLIAELSYEFRNALEEYEADDEERNITLATGVDAAKYIKKLVDEATEKWHNLKCNVVAIRNEFFGETITVAGLVTAQDIMKQLKDKDLGDYLVLPECMLKHEQDKFLDDYTIEDVEKALNTKVMLSDLTGEGLLRVLLNK